MVTIKSLVITSILPVTDLPNKVDENDVILVTEKRIKARHKNIKFDYIFMFPKSNRFLALLNRKWRAYNELAKKDKTLTKFGSEVFAIPTIRIPRVSSSISHFAFQVSIFLLKRKIADLITIIKPSIVHAHNLQSNGLFAKYIKDKFGIPYIITARIDKQISFSKIEKEIFRCASAIICLTPSHKKKIPFEFQDKATLITHGVDEEFFISRTTIKNDPFQIITIARLLPYKNIEKVIIALSTTKHKFHYHIYGRGPEHAKLKSLISDLSLENRVFLHGHADYKMIPDILASMDLFVLPSFPETFGRVYIEALAAGVPIVACKGSGMDGIIKDKKEGFLLDKPNIDNIRNVLELILQNPGLITTMRNDAQQTAQQFHWDRVVSDLHALYKKHSLPN